MMKISPLLWVLLLLSACSLPSREDVVDATKEAIYAVPILNDEIKLQDIFTNASGETQVTFDDEGKMTVIYEGEVLNDPSTVVFPPIFGLFDIPFQDSVFSLDLSQGATENVLDSAVFLQDKLFFKYVSSRKEPVTIHLWIDEIKKDGKPIGQTFIHPGSPDETPLEISAPPIDVAGFNMAGNNNIVTLRYDARLPNGERIEIDQVKFNWNILQFSYIQGYFPRREREVTGSFIPINLYERWIGGTMDFVDPKIELFFENSFGFAVAADFKEMKLEMVGGEEFDIEADVIDDGIIFNFPAFDEMGQVKETYLEFNTENSNLDKLFEDRVAKFIYRINAIANPDDDPNFIGYMRDDSYYAVQLRVVVPMHLAINNLQLVDTFDIDLNLERGFLDTAAIKIVLENNFPIDVETQLYMLDGGNHIIDSLFENGKIFLKGGTYSGGAVLSDVEKQSYFIEFDDEKIENLLNTKRILAKPTFLSTPNGLDPLWIYDTYGLKVKMGVKFSLE